MENHNFRILFDTQLSLGKCSFDQKYSVGRLLGEGASGTVYKASSLGGSETLAVKIVHCRDEETHERYQREFDALRQISHPSIIKPVDLFVDNKK